MNFYVDVLGCPKNEADCAILKAHLKKMGNNVVDNLSEADAVIVDTCGFILNAKKESIEEILTYVELKKERNLKVFVTGCLVQRFGKELKKEIPEVDGWFGVVEPKKIAENIGKKSVIPDMPNAVYNFYGRVDNKQYAYVKISDGCDRACSFCTIPLFKGSFKSRKIEDLLNEVKFLVNSGIKEVILVAQDTTGYGIDLYGEQKLPELLKRINDIPGDFWVRVMYMHPDHITDKIIEAFSYEKVLKYFDMPIQYASNNILRLMNRTRKVEELLLLINKIRNFYSNAVLRTGIIVGFPGETDEEFQKMLEFVKEVKFDRLGAFLYSDEEEAASFKLDGKVPRKLAEERLEELMDIQAQISLEKNEKLVGKVLKVLFDEEEAGVLVGRSYMDAPEIDGSVFVKGNFKKGFFNVKITSADIYDLEGEFIEE
ncbi:MULTISPECIES: 30S ribosomal protein S12 methylthiotransferase RimO [unclassified Thermosipho (in: thermotogales)]|uniref:30S ribosomal protein S12 methylthiotransferase RimO n=1 Tax=unclassified Thermosipho (in: thermotogales) TaxID=2676525 RepID=UPI000986ED6C|nr:MULTISPECIES: 30S ribosomal protein S12 methylthiotransferase RimO [unclassified Thermosipho (in: thermotogales)]MBT1248225.1 ribosomal protein S12 methylthiotransferase RimO [Thermosipho sp. 1244]OOC46483.1 ribosomal protein S12 methylthiotransferase RimO [Thermosipho sp. 1223]